MQTSHWHWKMATQCYNSHATCEISWGRIIHIFKAALAILARFFMAADAQMRWPIWAHAVVCDGKL